MLLSGGEWSGIWLFAVAILFYFMIFPIVVAFSIPTVAHHMPRVRGVEGFILGLSSAILYVATLVVFLKIVEPKLSKDDSDLMLFPIALGLPVFSLLWPVLVLLAMSLKRRGN